MQLRELSTFMISASAHIQPSCRQLVKVGLVFAGCIVNSSIAAALNFHDIRETWNSGLRCSRFLPTPHRIDIWFYLSSSSRSYQASHFLILLLLPQINKVIKKFIIIKWIRGRPHMWLIKCKNLYMPVLITTIRQTLISPKVDLIFLCSYATMKWVGLNISSQELDLQKYGGVEEEEPRRISWHRWGCVKSD